MDNIFAGMDIPKILGYGLSGLSLLLMFLAYQLLRKVISVHHPERGVLSLVKFYVVMTLLVIISVGVFSFPIAKKNADLASTNERLTYQSKAFVFAENLQSETDSMQASTNADEIRKHLKAIHAASDSLARILPAIDPQLTKAALTLRNDVKATETNFNIIAAADPASAPAKFQQHTMLLHSNVNTNVIQPLKKIVVK